MRILAIDPGPVNSGYYSGDHLHGSVAWSGVMDNVDLLAQLRGMHVNYDLLGLEMMEARGMPLGDESLETVWWTGRFFEAYRGKCALVKRRNIKLELCGTSRAKDANVRAALLDIYGAKGTKRNPNPMTYGVSSHAWAAMAVWHYLSTSKDTG